MHLHQGFEVSVLAEKFLYKYIVKQFYIFSGKIYAYKNNMSYYTIQ